MPILLELLIDSTVERVAVAHELLEPVLEEVLQMANLVVESIGPLVLLQRSFVLSLVVLLQSLGSVLELGGALILLQRTAVKADDKRMSCAFPVPHPLF